ncbi:MAG: HAD-IB family phosphatase [Verrucomicrobiota bacterium]
MTKILAFDCDSTLSAIEGVDELARFKGQSVFKQVESLTNQAMNGQISVEEVFGKRLEMIRPTEDECLKIGKKYIERVEPTALYTIHSARKNGWTPIIISGGFVPVIKPLAEYLNIETIQAVPLHFDNQGNYKGFDSHYPSTRDGGKIEMIKKIKAVKHPEKIIMVGDGNSDLETQSEVDLFVGFGGFVQRPKVKTGAKHFIHKLQQVLPLLGI